MLPLLSYSAWTNFMHLKINLMGASNFLSPLKKSRSNWEVKSSISTCVSGLQFEFLINNNFGK